MHRGTQGKTGRARYSGAGGDPLSARPLRLAPLYLLLTLMLCAVLLAPGPVSAGPDPALKIAVFPFGNLSEDMDAQTAVMPAIRDRLAEMGMELADKADVNRILFKDRVRDTAYVSLDVASELRDELGVGAVFLGCIVSFVQGDSPQIGLTARLIDTRTGRILWANYASATGIEFAGILGLGQIRSIDRLMPKAVDRLLGSARPEGADLQNCGDALREQHQGLRCRH
jgi:hypothetical protein